MKDAADNAFANVEEIETRGKTELNDSNLQTDHCGTPAAPFGNEFWSISE
jgi:hypothetical protein